VVDAESSQKGQEDVKDRQNDHHHNTNNKTHLSFLPTFLLPIDDDGGNNDLLLLLLLGLLTICSPLLTPYALVYIYTYSMWVPPPVVSDCYVV